MGNSVKRKILQYALPLSFLTIPAFSSFSCGSTDSKPAPCIDADGDGVYTAESCGRTIDCDDANPLTWQTIPAYADNDGDGYGAGDVTQVCTTDTLPSGYAVNNLDCDDRNNTIYPGSFDLCDGIDNDCDPITRDGDGEPTPFNEHQAGVCRDSRQACVEGAWQDTYTGIRKYEAVELSCDDLDNNCDGEIDNIIPPSRRCTVGIGACMTSSVEYQTCWGESGWSPEYSGCDAVPGTPTMELCDDLDQDCDGNNYNGFPFGEPCSVGVEECAVLGVYVCSPDGLSVRCDAVAGEPREEICDGLDNNCDGEIDNSLLVLSRSCTMGIGECRASGLEYQVCEGASGWSMDYRNCNAVPGIPTMERCDELDHDCDGNNYNGFPLGEPCTSGLGECSIPGVYVCSPDGLAAICDAVPGDPAEEICDGLDNNCDGEIDNGLMPLSRSCTIGIGECRASGLEYQVCEGASGWSADYRNCDAVPRIPAMERCDELDHDCDGNNYNSFPLGEPCTSGLGECSVPGVYVCNREGAAICDAMPGVPAEEICDGLDNDCNGIIDGVRRASPICGGSIEECVQGSWYSVQGPSSIKNEPADAGLSCNDILTRGLSRGDGVYWIDPNGGARDDAFLVLCDMTIAGGGWTLVMQSLANDDTFRYSSAYWSDNLLYNSHLLVPGCATAKYQSYVDLRGREYMLNLIANRDNRSMYTHPTRISPRALFSMIDNTIRPDGTNLDMSEWTIYPPPCASSRGEGYVATIVHPVDRVLVRWDVQHYSAVGLGHAAAGIGIRIEPVWSCNGEWGSKDAVLLWIK